MISIHIDAPTAYELRCYMRELLNDAAEVPAEPQTGDAPKAIDGEINPPAKTRRTAKKATAPEQPVTDIDANGDPVADTPAPAAQPEPEVQQPTIEEVKKALVDLAKACGTDAVYAILAEHKVSNASGIHTAGKGRDAIDAAAKMIAEKEAKDAAAVA